MISALGYAFRSKASAPLISLGYSCRALPFINFSSRLCRVAVEQEGLLEQALRLLAGGEQIDGGCAGLKAENGHADHVGKLVLHVIEHGHPHPADGDVLGDQKDEKDRSIGEDPVDRLFLDRLAEGDPVDDLREHQADDKAHTVAHKFRPAEKLRDRLAEAVAQRRNKTTTISSSVNSFFILLPLRKVDRGRKPGGAKFRVCKKAWHERTCADARRPGPGGPGRCTVHGEKICRIFVTG